MSREHTAQRPTTDDTNLHSKPFSLVPSAAVRFACGRRCETIAFLEMRNQLIDLGSGVRTFFVPWAETCCHCAHSLVPGRGVTT